MTKLSKMQAEFEAEAEEERELHNQHVEVCRTCILNLFEKHGSEAMKAAIRRSREFGEQDDPLWRLDDLLDQLTMRVEDRFWVLKFRERTREILQAFDQKLRDDPSFRASVEAETKRKAAGYENERTTSADQLASDAGSESVSG